MKHKYVGVLIGIFAFAFIIYGVLNANAPTTPLIFKYHTELDPRFGKNIPRYNSAGHHVVADNGKTKILDAGLGSDLFIIDKDFTADKIVAARDAFVANDVLEINFPSTEAAFSILKESEIKGKRYVELGLYHFMLGEGKNGIKDISVLSQPLIIEARAIDQFFFSDGTVVYYKDILDLNLHVAPNTWYSPVFQTDEWLKSWF